MSTFKEHYRKGVKDGRKSASDALESEIEMLRSTINGMMKDRRFEAAKAAMQGILPARDDKGRSAFTEAVAAEIAGWAVKQADALIEELNRDEAK